MNVHVIRSTEVNSDRYEQLMDLVDSISGPVIFHRHEHAVEFTPDEISTRPFIQSRFKKIRNPHRMFVELRNDYNAGFPPPYPDEVQIVTWTAIFSKCHSFRISEGLPDQDHVILLTDHVNDHNWFTAADPSGVLNHFIHTGQWEFFLPCDPKFPIAYEVMGTIIRRVAQVNLGEYGILAHRNPVGCVSDFCQEKSEITLKLRTGDICPDCMRTLHERSIDPRIIEQVFHTFDSIRTQMLFRERYRIAQRPSRMEIIGNTKKIYFTDMANTELKLTPLERTLYLLFLKEEGGLQLHELPEHENWIRDTYRQIGNPQTIAQLNNSIQSLINRTENSAMEKISRIKSKIIQITGEELAAHYIIDGPRGEKKKIALDRSLVTGNYS